MFVPFMMTYLRTRLPKLRTNWSLDLSTSVRRSLLLRFLSDAIHGNCRPAKGVKVWPPILPRHMSEPQSEA